MGPLSVKNIDPKLYRMNFMTDEQREQQRLHGGLVTGKTAQKKHKGSPVSEDKAPKNLARRIRKFENLKSKDGFRRPGSNKKS